MQVIHLWLSWRHLWDVCFPALWRWILINRFIQMTLSRRFPVYEKECTLITIQISLFMDLLTLKRKGGTWTCGYVYLCSELYAFCVPVLSSGMMMQISKNVDFMFPLFLSCHTESSSPGPHKESMKMTKGLESCSLRKDWRICITWRRENLGAPHHSTLDCKGLLPRGQRRRHNGYKLHGKRFHLNIRKRFF